MIKKLIKNINKLLASNNNTLTYKTASFVLSHYLTNKVLQLVMSFT